MVTTMVRGTVSLGISDEHVCEKKKNIKLSQISVVSMFAIFAATRTTTVVVSGICALLGNSQEHLCETNLKVL